MKVGKHIVEQPLHKTLKQYRLMAIISMSFIGYLMVTVWYFFETNHTTLSAAGAAGLFSFIAALLGAFIKCVNNIQGRHEE